MRRVSLVSSVVAAAGLSACANGPIDPVDLIATDIKMDAEHPEMSRLPDGSIAQRYIVVLRNDLHLEGFAPGIISELVVDNDIRMERFYQHALGGFAATLTANQLATLQARPDVDFVVPDTRMEAINNGNGNDPELQGRPTAAAPPATDWNVTDVMGAAWATSGGGLGITVSVLDTGVDGAHTGLPTAAGCLGDFTEEATGSCQDHHGHGTHVTGTIAMDDYTTPTAGNRIRGIARDVTLLPGRVLDSSGSGLNSGIIAAVDAADAAGSDVINMSLGGQSFQTEATDALCVAINNAAAGGTLTVVAAGNEGRDAAGYSPAHCSQALTVGSYDSNGKLSSFSNWGSVVDINAPGSDIVSAELGTNWYVYMSGTSMASPHAAAVAALYLQDHAGSSVADAIAGIVTLSSDRPAPTAYNKRISSTKPKLDGRDY
jgi:subtilisin family serine protease